MMRTTSIFAGMLVAACALAAVAHADGGADALLNDYYAKEKQDPAAAVLILEDGAKQFPADRRIVSELAYARLRANDKAGALDAFLAAHRLEPDEEIAMQIGYLQQELGQNRAAADTFAGLMNSKDAARAKQAAAAYRVMRAMPDKALRDPWFAETYAAPEYRSDADVAVLPVEARVGLDLGNVETYLGLRATRDSRSGQSTFGPVTFYDNAALVALGLRLKPVEDAPFALFAEAGAALDLVDRDRKRWRGDVRGGLLVYDEWKDCETGAPCFVADAYADAVYFSRYDDNVLFTGRARPGLRLIDGADHALDAYALVAAGADSDGVVDNRYAELGLGLALRLYDLPLTMRAEAVQVDRRSGDDGFDFRFRVEHQMRF